jgi:hypothetical protein
VGTPNDDDDDSAEVSLYDRFRNMAGTRYALMGLWAAFVAAIAARLLQSDVLIRSPSPERGMRNAGIWAPQR